MSDEGIVKLINAPLKTDQYMGFVYLFKKYPRLIQYVVPDPKTKGNHEISYSDVMENSPIYGIVNDAPGVSFKWDNMFDYLWK